MHLIVAPGVHGELQHFLLLLPRQYFPNQLKSLSIEVLQPHHEISACLLVLGILVWQKLSFGPDLAACLRKSYVAVDFESKQVTVETTRKYCNFVCPPNPKPCRRNIRRPICPRGRVRGLALEDIRVYSVAQLSRKRGRRSGCRNCLASSLVSKAGKQ